MRIQIGQIFILGFIVVVAVVVLVPYGVAALDLPEWARGIIPPLGAIAIGLAIGPHHDVSLSFQYLTHERGRQTTGGMVAGFEFPLY